MPDKSSQQAARAQKEKARQASLLDATEDRADSIDSTVSKAFDSDPSVRLRVAQELARVDDPRAIFALIELSSDKDESVKETAQRALGNYKERDEIVSLEKLLSARKEVRNAPLAAQPEGQATPPAQRQNMMPAIERLFAHYEPKKRESVKRKLLPSLQKLFGFRPDELDPLQGIDKMGHATQLQPEKAEEPHKAEKVDSHSPQNATNFPYGQHAEPTSGARQERREPEEEVEKSDMVPIDDEGSEFVGGDVPSDNSDGEDEGEEFAIRHSRLFELAYGIARTPGMGKAELKREQNRIVSSFKKEVDYAFRLAALRAADDGLASFSNLKPGMKNLSFSPMAITSISEVAYGARRKPYSRICLTDGKKEVPLLVPRERATGISVADKLAPKKVAADFIVEKNEVVLLAVSKSQIVVYK
ncbi:MAG: HEAT repeat domain-containing protein [Candidatus Micrarchaeota archaeon]|nr:HEAT repeat domain-containing protein [Candidatus Micrarchaeota archaeon]